MHILKKMAKGKTIYISTRGILYLQKKDGFYLKTYVIYGFADMNLKIQKTD